MNNSNHQLQDGDLNMIIKWKLQVTHQYSQLKNHLLGGDTTDIFN